ncbi:MAG: hypothetical protein ACM3H8_14355 [Sphingobacteriales bacterium]
MKNKLLIFFAVLLLASCNSANKKTGISLKREKISSTPVREYSEKIPDKLNEWSFKVQLFETDSTFTYLLKTNYKAIEYEQKIRYPNLGYLPRPELKKGFYDKTVLVGFLDEAGKFMDYKMVYVVDEELGVRGVKRYTVTAED